ncbi:MAG TPA: ABC transporter permease [Anaerolineales bacterium]|nr:ABC transporter permease [Anaerolineales bacterium]
MKILDIALKDLLRFSRSLFLIGMTLAAPLLVTFLIYAAFGSMADGEVAMPAVQVGVVNADALPAGAAMDASLGESIRSMFFDESVQSWITASDYPDAAAARAALDAQEIGVAVIIPQDFTQAYLAGEAKPLTILQDPTLSTGPAVVREMITSLLDGVAGGGVMYEVINARLSANGQALDPSALPVLFQRYADWYTGFQRALFHAPGEAALVLRAPAVGPETGRGLQAMMGAVMAGQMIFFSFFTGAYAMMSILQEAEEGTLPRLFTTPTRRTAILAGKFLAVLLTVILQGLVMLLAGRLLFSIRWGQPAAVGLAFVGQMFAAVGLAVLLVAFIKTSRQAGPIFGGALTALGMVSGLFTTNINMPEAFNALGSFTPQGWVLKAWKLALSGQPPSEVLVPFLVLVGMGLVMFVVGAAFFRRRFA